MKKLTLLITTLSLAAACGGETDDPDDLTGGGKEDGVCLSSSRSKALVPSLPLPASPRVGKPMSDAVAAQLAGATLLSEQPVIHPDVASGSFRSYRRGDDSVEHELVTWRNGAKEEFVRVRRGGALMLALADHDGNNTLDGWMDDEHGYSERDWNRDGRLDWISQAVNTIPGFVIEGYGDAWTPPAVPAKRILEDKDYDGDFDEESITGKGNSWWSYHGRGCD